MLSQLPAELILTIIESCTSKEQVCALRLTCRSLHRLAQPIFARDVLVVTNQPCEQEKVQSDENRYLLQRHPSFMQLRLGTERIDQMDRAYKSIHQENSSKSSYIEDLLQYCKMLTLTLTTDCYMTGSLIGKQAVKASTNVEFIYVDLGIVSDEDLSQVADIFKQIPKNTALAISVYNLDSRIEKVLGDSNIISLHVAKVFDETILSARTGIERLHISTVRTDIGLKSMIHKSHGLKTLSTFVSSLQTILHTDQFPESIERLEVYEDSILLNSDIDFPQKVLKNIKSLRVDYDGGETLNFISTPNVEHLEIGSKIGEFGKQNVAQVRKFLLEPHPFVRYLDLSQYITNDYQFLAKLKSPVQVLHLHIDGELLGDAMNDLKNAIKALNDCQEAVNKSLTTLGFNLDLVGYGSEYLVDEASKNELASLMVIPTQLGQLEQVIFELPHCFSPLPGFSVAPPAIFDGVNWRLPVRKVFNTVHASRLPRS